jgi:hypothetical protein
VFSPLDRRLKVGREGWSERVQQQIVKLVVRGSYGEAVDTYRELVGVMLAKTTVWERSQERGRRLREQRDKAAEQGWQLPRRQEMIAGEVIERNKQAVSIDGAMVYILGEAWKEVKVGCVFAYATQERFCRRSQEMIEVVEAKEQSYTACLGEPEPFAKLLTAEAERRGLYRAREQTGIADGAKWIWNVMRLCFPGVREVVDWNHAVSHIWQAAHLAFGVDDPRAKRWVKPREDCLWKGQVHTVIHDIEGLKTRVPAQAEPLETEAGYFRNNAHRMRYQEFREDSCPIGSGTVESACKQLIDARMRGSGMRWSRTGAENMLALRCEYLSNRWDDAWRLTLAA